MKTISYGSEDMDWVSGLPWAGGFTKKLEISFWPEAINYL